MLTAYALFITLMFGLQIAAIVLTVLYKVTTIYIHSIPLILFIKIVITIIMSKPITASSRPHLLKIVITMIISIIVLTGRAKYYHHHVKADHGQGEADEHTRNLLKSSLSTYTTEAPRDAVSNNYHVE